MRPIFFLCCFFAFQQMTAQTTINYQSSSDDFPNPERGFYRYSETRSGSYSLLSQAELESYRQWHTPPTANYSIYSTLIFRYFFLEDFKTSNISQSFLNNMQTDFNTARAAGVKIIPRFAYTDEVNDTGCGNWICPPYGDAPKAWVLTHISQLAPVLEANKDVIAAVQMGFIGVWGENYYTDYFGDASQAPDYKLTDDNWSDRIEVLNALLDAVPEERMVQVRYPQMKQRTVYGISAPTSSAALGAAEAFTGTNKARIGFHNDCLLASADDYGTYTDYGNTATSSGSDTTNLKPYFAADSRYVVVGGETCDDAFSPQNDCASSDPAAYGDTELERMHYSYLNAQYNNDVNNDWVTDNCMEDIKKRLGYRLELQSGTFSDAAQPGQIMDINISLQNLGFAAPFNERGVELILRNTSTSERWYANLNTDPRLWLADGSTYTISESLCLPGEIPTGDYELLLHLPDPMPLLYANPGYSIRLANKLPDNSDVWEGSTGYNQLGHTITIDNMATNNACNTETTFASSSAILPVQFIHFKAVPAENTIQLSWATSVEINNKGFELQRSKDAKVFSSVAFIAGYGTTEERQDYQYTDTDVQKEKTYYYRLAQIDVDGRTTYSSVVSGRLESIDGWQAFAESIQIFPNPTTSDLYIQAEEAKITIQEIEIRNLLGQLVFSKTGNTGSCSVSHLPKGSYILSIKTERGMVSKKWEKM